MTLKLAANLRQNLGRHAIKVRQAGKIPAVLYGHKIDNLNLELDYVEFEKTLERTGESTILDIVVDGQEPLKALVSEVQYAPVSGRISHVDLHQINMKEKINANVEIKFSGESRVVKEDGGLVIHNFSELEIRCMPADLIHEIVVDVSALKNFEDVITVADLKLPDILEVIDHEPEDVVAIAVKPKAEAEEAPVAAAAEGDAAAGAPVAGAEGAKPEGEKIAEKK